MAVRFGCPIYIYENIFDVAGVENPEKSAPVSQVKSIAAQGNDNTDIKSLGLEELHILLNEVLEQEDYIRAISIRDEINSRKK